VKPSASALLRSLAADDNLHSTASIVAAGISRMAIGRAVEAGWLIQYGRGAFCTPDALSRPGIGLAAVSLRYPSAVACMFTAAHWHDVSDEDPPEAWIALDRSVARGAIEGYPHFPVRTVWWPPEHVSDASGVVTVEMAGVPVRITDLPRTVVDLVRFRDRTGDEPAMKALHDYIRSGAPVSDLWDRAKAVGALGQLEPFVRAAEEFSESIPVRGP
jgi:hypothetical protein